MVNRLLSTLCSFVSCSSLLYSPQPWPDAPFECGQSCPRLLASCASTLFLSSFLKGGARLFCPCHNGDSMMGYKVWCNFRECRTGEVRRMHQPVETVAIW